MDSFQCAGFSVFLLASDTDWLATITDSSLGEASAKEADGVCPDETAGREAGVT